MIAFVWSDNIPLYSGRGGSETYTIGQVRELQLRRIPVKIITIGLGDDDGRQFFPDITFESIKTASDLSKSDDTLIFINYPFDVPTKKQSYVIMHIPPVTELDALPAYHKAPPDYTAILPKHTIVVNSRYLRDLWANYASLDLNKINVVYPFADPAFANVKRPPAKPGVTRVLFAGRLNPEKGIYTFLESLHHRVLREGYEFTVTLAGNQTEEGEIIAKILQCHSLIDVIPAQHSPEDMAKLLARHDVVVLPSIHTYWHEAFGMISVEAQHAGCWVVASNDGGLPETDCGSLSLCEPGNSFSLAKTIQLVGQGGAPSEEQRKRTHRHFTRKESTDSLLAVLNGTYGTQKSA